MMSVLWQATWHHNDTGKFPCKQLSFSLKKMWAFNMKRAIKIFMPVQTWYRRRSASVHLTPWRSEVPKTSRCFVSASLALSCKRTHRRIMKRSPRDLCFFEVAAEKCQENYCKQGWRMVVGGGLKESRGKQKHTPRRARAAQLAHGGTVLIPRISSAWHLLASMENDCRWKMKANDLMLTFLLPLWISIR